MASFIWPPEGASQIAQYPTFADFPASAPNGTLAQALDTLTLYSYSTTNSAWEAIASPGDALSIGILDSNTPSGNGATINVNALTMQSASTSDAGLVNTTTQSFLGQKTFSTGLTGTLTGSASLNVLTSALGNLTDAGTDGITITGGTGAVVGNVSIAQHVADSSHNGYLSSTDWSTFNGKQNAFSGLTTDGVLYATSATAVASTGAGTTGQSLIATTSGAPSWGIPVSATNLAGGAANSIPYQTGSGATSFLAASTGILVYSGGILQYTTAPNVSTAAFYDNSTLAASTAFVQNAINLSMGYLPLNLGGSATGTYSFASTGLFGTVSITTTAGAVTGISSISGAGSGYKVGDLVNIISGNHDCVLRVATLSGSGVASFTILYGGTGYSDGFDNFVPATTYTFTFALSGTLSGDVTILCTPGTYLTQGNQFIVYNNTTGAHNLTFQMSSGSDAAIGTGVTIPQGSSNSLPIFINTDGLTDVWYGDTPLASRLNGTVPVANGGTGFSTYTAGDLLYCSATNVLSKLAIGTSGQALVVSSGLLPAWSAAGTGTVTSVTFTGDGTVLSSTPSSAVTTSGTVTASLNTQTANKVLAGPTTGSAANPTFRSQVYADVSPALKAPTVQTFLASYYYTFTITSHAFIAGDTYTNNGQTFTAVYSGTSTSLVMSAPTSTAPTSSGTLTWASGSGSGNITFSSVATNGTYQLPSGPAPLYIKVRMVGGGGGGAGETGSGGNGGDTTFGTGTAAHGVGGNYSSGAGGTGGNATLGTGWNGIASPGGTGQGYSNTGSIMGGMGAASPFGGAGGGSASNVTAPSAVANSGSGGGGAGASLGYPGGGAGGYIEAQINSPSSTYTFVIGLGGANGASGGGSGGSGIIIVEEYYQ